MKTSRMSKADVLTIVVKHHDNTGGIEVNGHLVNKRPEYNQAQGFLGAATIILRQLEFRKITAQPTPDAA